LTPIPITTASPRISARIPATLRRLSMTSFGHLIWAESDVAISTASAVAAAATSDSSGADRSAGGRTTTDMRTDVPGGSSQSPPRRPRPAVWWSVVAMAPSGTSSMRSKSTCCVDSHSGSCSRGSPITGLRGNLFHPDGGDLVLGRADQRVADVVREPVHLGLREVERHPEETGIAAVADDGAGLELAAARDEPRPVAVAESEVGRVLGRDLEERIFLLVDDPVLAHGHRRRVVVVERPAGGEDERVLGVGLLDRRLVLDPEELSPASWSRHAGSA